MKLRSITLTDVRRFAGTTAANPLGAAVALHDGMRITRDERGTTLVEAIVAAGLLVTLATGTATLIGLARRLGNSAEQLMAAATLRPRACRRCALWPGSTASMARPTRLPRSRPATARRSNATRQDSSRSWTKPARLSDQERDHPPTRCGGRLVQPPRLSATRRRRSSTD